MSDVFSSLFLWTLLFIFLSAIVGAIISQRKRDRCLRLLDDYHVTLTMTSGQVIWGDLRVFANGMRLDYDAPYSTDTGLIKSGYLLYAPEMAEMLALCRYVGNLTEEEARERRRQVLKHFRPGFLRRTARGIRNIFATIRDAFNQALSAFIGQVTKTSGSKVMATGKGQMEQIGKTLLGEVGKAYEPMLERQIGKPIVLELACPKDPKTRNIELAGYLAEYSDKYLAIFSIEHPVVETIELTANEPTETSGVHLRVAEHELVVTNEDEVPLVIEAMISDDGDERELGIVLTNAASARLPRIDGELTVRLSRVRRIDLVCPRAQGVIRYASQEQLDQQAGKHLPPAHEDRKVWFP